MFVTMALFTLSATLSLIFVVSKTPLMMALLIVAQTMLVTLSIYAFLSTSWLSFILFMVLISAMMVIFVYVSSLASNDFLALAMPVTLTSVYYLAALTALATLLLTGKESHPTSKSNISDTDMGPLAYYNLYASNNSYITMFLIIYLLIALIVVAKISMSSKGALRALKP